LDICNRVFVVRGTVVNGIFLTAKPTVENDGLQVVDLPHFAAGTKASVTDKDKTSRSARKDMLVAAL